MIDCIFKYILKKVEEELREILEHRRHHLLSYKQKRENYGLLKVSYLDKVAQQVIL